MVKLELFRKIALSFPGAEESAHFEKISFIVRKKIFATYDNKTGLACIKLSEIDQNIFSLAGKPVIYPVPNKWGRFGWTYIHLDKIGKDILKNALGKSYSEVAPKKLSSLFRTA
jgi:predicted DNA-binding protein (MmcQ/YjbR family)